MACVQEKFEAIRLEPIKKKYYSMAEVDPLLEKLRKYTQAVENENDELRKRVCELNQQKTEIAEAIVSAKTIAQKIISDAHERGQEIIGEAEEKKRELSIRIDAAERRFTRRLIQCVNEMNDELYERGLPALEEQTAPVAVAAPPASPAPAAEKPQAVPVPAADPATADETPVPAPVPEKTPVPVPEETPAPTADSENLPDDLYRRLEEIADSLLAIEDKT